MGGRRMSDMQTSGEANRNRPAGISRRTLVKGAAWAVPAVTVLGATPAMARSQDFYIDASLSCKDSPNSDFYFVMNVTNVPEGTKVTVTSWSFTGTSLVNPTPPCFTVQPGQTTQPIRFDAVNSNSNGTLTLTISVVTPISTFTTTLTSVVNGYESCNSIYKTPPNLPVAMCGLSACPTQPFLGC